MSLDGFLAGLDDSMDWPASLPIETMARIGAILAGQLVRARARAVERVDGWRAG